MTIASWTQLHVYLPWGQRPSLLLRKLIVEPMDRFTALIHYYILRMLETTHLFTKVTLKVSQKGPNGEPCLALQESVKSPGL